jgi:hypothetical protein
MDNPDGSRSQAFLPNGLWSRKSLLDLFTVKY